MTLTVSSDPATNPDAEVIRDHLIRFNHEKSGGTDFRPLQVILHDTEGTACGGLLGWTVWSWFHIDSLWVDPEYRGQDWGTRLLATAEAEAKERDCEVCDVDTFNFQALDFYLKTGYELYGTLSGIGKGTLERYYLRKQL